MKELQASPGGDRSLLQVCGDKSTPQDVIENKDLLNSLILEHEDELLENHVPIRKALMELDARRLFRVSQCETVSQRERGATIEASKLKNVWSYFLRLCARSPLLVTFIEHSFVT